VANIFFSFYYSIPDVKSGKHSFLLDNDNARREKTTGSFKVYISLEKIAGQKRHDEEKNPQAKGTVFFQSEYNPFRSGWRTSTFFGKLVCVPEVIPAKNDADDIHNVDHHFPEK
jgi:hypothetical protein